MSERLQRYVDTWWQAINDLTALLETLAPEQWDAPTDLPGWNVRAIAAHTAHLEAITAGDRHVGVEVGEPAHVRSPMGVLTEQGVVARHDRSADELINEIRESATTRHTALLADPPSDGSTPAPGLLGAIGWDTEMLLRNRPLDVWMHEQDIRRAIEEPGNLDSRQADHAVEYLLESIPMVLAKRCQAPPGTSLVVTVNGTTARACVVGDDGRGHLVEEAPAQPTAALTMDRETFIIRAGGRRRDTPDSVAFVGDQALGRRVVDSMSVTP